MKRPMLLNIIISMAIGYAAIVALVFVFQSRLVYYPQIGGGITLTPLAHGLNFESVNIHTEDGETLHAWWVPVTQTNDVHRGAVLFFHGNAGNISHRLDYLTMFHRLGYATLIVDYRGYGQSTGAPSEEGTYRDATAAWRWLTEKRSIGPGEIVIAGESLGGAVATWLGSRHTPRALLLFSTFTSITNLAAEVYPFLPVRLISRFSYDNLGRIAQITAPIFIAHSRDDDIVPYAQGEELFAAAREPKQFLEMRGGHNDGFIFVREEWIRTLQAFLERYSDGRAAHK